MSSRTIAETEAVLAASLPRRVASLVRKTEHSIYPETGEPYTTYNYYPIGPVPADARDDLEAAFNAFDHACRPASRKELVTWLTRLHCATISRNTAQEDLDLKLALYVDELSPFPGEIVADVLRRACTRCRWWPPLADLVVEIGRLSQRRQAMRSCLWQMLQRHEVLTDDRSLDGLIKELTASLRGEP